MPPIPPKVIANVLAGMPPYYSTDPQAYSPYSNQPVEQSRFGNLFPNVLRTHMVNNPQYVGKVFPWSQGGGLIPQQVPQDMAEIMKAMPGKTTP